MRYAVQQDQLSLTGCPAVGTGWHLVSFTDLFCGHILLNMQAADAKIAAPLCACARCVAQANRASNIIG